MRIYISGPMTGYENYNFPAFERACEIVRDAGHTPVSPHEHGSELGDAGWADYLRKDIADLVTCDAICVLPGWEKSKGASLENYIADQLGMPRMTLEEVRGQKAPVS